MRFFALLFLAILPFSAFAQEGDSVTRSEAFLLIWDGIHRPAFENKKSFADLSEDHPGHLEITYAKERKILDDEENFRPGEPVFLEDVLIWLYRTRNVDDITEMQKEHLPTLISRYPITEMNRSLNGRVTVQDLIDMTRKLDGMLRNEVHEVSFYGEDFHGQGTAFGETFDMHDITAAHRTFPHDTLVKVTNVETGDNIIVRINDRGPYVDGRDMDLSEAAFGEIAHHGEGVIKATFERLGDKGLVDRCEQQERTYQRRVTRDVRFFRGVPHTFTLGDQLILQSNRAFVLLGITFPDGAVLRMQDFVHPGEKYRFSPDSSGTYDFLIGDTQGHVRKMHMKVSACVLPNAA